MSNSSPNADSAAVELEPVRDARLIYRFAFGACFINSDQADSETRNDKSDARLNIGFQQALQHAVDGPREIFCLFIEGNTQR